MRKAIETLCVRWLFRCTSSDFCKTEAAEVFAMRRNLVSPLGLFAAHAAASLVNIRFLFHGRTTPVQWLCFAVTLLYIGYWLLYSRKSTECRHHSIHRSVFRIHGRLRGCPVRLEQQPAARCRAFADGRLFAGLEAVFPAPWLWIAGALVSAAVVLFSLRVKHRR